jgi:hypothetical protein
VADALDTIPRGLARREYVPPRIALTIFGLGCFEGGRELLRSYLEVARLALARFDSPGLPNRLSRADVVARLQLSDSEADRLSGVLMADAPFLGSGDADIARWDREVDPRAEEFEGISDVDALLSHLANRRGLNEGTPLGVVSTSIAQEPLSVDQGWQGEPEPHARAARSAGIVSAVAAVITLVATLVSSPSILNLALLGLFLGLAVYLFYFQNARPMGLAAILIFAVAGGVVGALLEPSPPIKPHGYFVATSDAAVVIPLIEPRLEAPEVRNDALVVGDKVRVRCILRAYRRAWAELDDGAFVEAGLLRPEVGGGEAPPC